METLEVFGRLRRMTDLWAMIVEVDFGLEEDFGGRLRRKTLMKVFGE